MAKLTSILHSILFLFLLAFPIYHSLASATGALVTYIVHVDPHPNSRPLLTSEQREAWYKSFLPEESRLVYSYHEAMTGFAARLSLEELLEVEKMPGYLHAYPDRVVPLLTTRTPAFMNLSGAPGGTWDKSDYGKGVIVGVLDSGVAPQLPSFRDEGGILPPPPSKWRGECEFGAGVCSNKLVGAKNFVRGMQAMQEQSLPSSALQAAPYDADGHGTHTASTAAGMFVDHADVEGQASGTAAGMAPYAHLAIYRVCSGRGCAVSDIMAAFDRAIYDGVDLLSLSLGGSSLPYYSDGVAIGAFGAIKQGIFVICAAGNAGPSFYSLSNEAPWILTVGASTLDRKIMTTITLGNGLQFDGESIHQPGGYPSPNLPLVFPGSTSPTAAACAPGTLTGIDVKGKIILCNNGQVSRVDKGIAVMNAGGAGMIIANGNTEGFNTFTDPHVLPASQVSYADGVRIKAYIQSNAAPTASIAYKGTVIGDPVAAPAVAYFSSRGPNKADPKILKPDIIGPGVNILAAWPFPVGNPGANYNIISGTSMATPHLSGIAALLKSLHPDWSPAAIKSAIMTTAYITTNNMKPIPDQNMNQANFFQMGAGHVNPAAASDPGLVYDLNSDDYVAYLCGMGYNDKQVSFVAGSTVKCSDYKPVSGSELNYPSFMVFVNDGNAVRVRRTVTNVEAGGCTYNAEVIAPAGAKMTVDPPTLSFSKAGDKAEFTVMFVGIGSGRSGVVYSEGYLTWVSSEHRVTSPVMVGVGGGGAGGASESM